MLSSRNQQGLTEREIARSELIWDVIGGNGCCVLDVSEADQPGSRTRFIQSNGIVMLGADVIPGEGTDARSSMSEMACLAHELAHAQRFRMGIDRSTDPPDVFLDEAEASIHASFTLGIGDINKQNLVEDARIQIAAWQNHTANPGANYEN